MSARIDRVSESHANAIALARRSSTYASEHTVSVALQMNRKAAQPKTLAGYVKEIREQYESEAPKRMHTHDVGDDGAPALSAEFARWLMEPADPQTLRRTLQDWYRSPHATWNRRARIVSRVALGASVHDAVVLEMGNPMDAEIVAGKALELAWIDVNSTPIARSSTAA